jgi:hypothetical protein
VVQTKSDERTAMPLDAGCAGMAARLGAGA